MIDPTANTLSYRMAKSLPDSRFGLWLLDRISRLRALAQPSGVTVEKVSIPRRSGGGQLKLFVIRRKGETGRLPIVLQLHGGGYAAGTALQDLEGVDRYLDAKPSVFVAPEYRLSTEAPYPAALEDCYDALLWARDNAETIGGRSDKIFVKGESAGGGLTAALCLLARDRGEVKIAGQFPLFGMFDDREENFTTSADPAALLWTWKKNLLGWDLYLKDVRAKGETPSAYAAPARAEDLSNLPPAYGFIGDQDLFLDENVRYFERLAAAGAPAELKVIKGLYHVGEVLAPDSKAGAEAWSFILDAYARALEELDAPQA